MKNARYVSLVARGAGRLVRRLGVRLYPPGGPGEGQGTALNHRQSGTLFGTYMALIWHLYGTYIVLYIRW